MSDHWVKFSHCDAGAAPDEVEAVVHDILDRAGLAIEGRTVLVKPNMLGGFVPERGATTDPRLIRAVVRALVARGAREILVGDSPGGADHGTRRTAIVSGQLDAAEGHFYNVGADVRLVDVRSRFIKQTTIPGRLLDVDLVINLPKLKTHGYMGFSACIKNMFGIVVGPAKAKLHFRAPTMPQFGELLLDIYDVRPPDLHLIDAMVVMEGDGPTSGPLRTENLIISGDNGLATDLVVAGYLGFVPEEIPYLRCALQRRMPGHARDRIEVIDPVAPLVDLRRPVTYAAPEEGAAGSGSGRPGLTANGLMELHRMGKMVPALERPEDCTGCQQCVKSCPAAAIAMRDGLPHIAYKECISCFCCSELCKENCYEILNTNRTINAIFDFLT